MNSLIPLHLNPILNPHAPPDPNPESSQYIQYSPKPPLASPLLRHVNQKIHNHTNHTPLNSEQTFRHTHKHLDVQFPVRIEYSRIPVPGFSPSALSSSSPPKEPLPPHSSLPISKSQSNSTHPIQRIQYPPTHLNTFPRLPDLTSPHFTLPPPSIYLHTLSNRLPSLNPKIRTCQRSNRSDLICVRRSCLIRLDSTRLDWGLDPKSESDLEEIGLWIWIAEQSGARQMSPSLPSHPIPLPSADFTQPMNLPFLILPYQS